MHLRAIEAVRYGALLDETLGDLGDELTVVYGPNEAGKSSFTSLVRHILYGFPRRGNERKYESPAGPRQGRLVFDDGTGLWSLTRTEGAHGGAVALTSPQGPVEADPFVAGVTQGVTGDVFRNVFGFGLGELADMKSLDDIRHHLHASAAGMRSDPRETLAGLEKLAADLYKERGKSRVKESVSRLKEVRNERRAVEVALEAATEDRFTVERLAKKMAKASEVSREARERAQTLRSLDDRLAALEGDISQERSALEDVQVRATSLAAKADGIVVDDALLEKNDAIEGLLARIPAVEASLERIDGHRAEQTRLSEETAFHVAELGSEWDVESLLSLPSGLDIDRTLDDRERGLTDASTDLKTARQAAARAETVAIEASTGLPVDIGTRDAREMIGALDTLLALGTGPTGGRTWPVWFAVLAVAVSLVASVAAVLLGQPLGFAVALVAAVFVVALVAESKKHPSGSSAVADECIRLLELGEIPPARELLRLRAELEREQDAGEKARKATEAVSVASAEVSRLLDVQKTAIEEWDSWKAAQGLPETIGDPRAVRIVLDQARRVRGFVDRAASSEEQIACEKMRVDAFVADAVVFAKESSVRDASSGILAIQSAHASLVEVRKVQKARDSLVEERRTAEERAQELELRLGRLAATRSSIMKEAKLDPGADSSALGARAAMASEDAEQAIADLTELEKESAALQTILESQASDTSLERLRIEEAGLLQKIDAALEEYAVVRAAVVLLADTLEAYERERQPEVVLSAGKIFGKMTQGRYPNLLNPVGAFDPTVADKEMRAKPAGLLSTATAEQLYLALRLGYLESLEGSSKELPVLMDDILVNFDDERRLEAVAAIAQFAQQRQVLFFTCHEATIEAFTSVVPGCVRLELERC